jgi:hypothetical protein
VKEAPRAVEDINIDCEVGAHKDSSRDTVVILESSITLQGGLKVCS